MVQERTETPPKVEVTGHSTETFVDQSTPWGKIINNALLTSTNQNLSGETLRIIVDSKDLGGQPKAVGFMTGSEAQKLGRDLTFKNGVFTLPPVEVSLMREETFNELVHRGIFVSVPKSRGALFELHIPLKKGREKICIVKKYNEKKGDKLRVQIFDPKHKPILTIPGY